MKREEAENSYKVAQIKAPICDPLFLVLYGVSHLIFLLFQSPVKELIYRRISIARRPLLND